MFTLAKSIARYSLGRRLTSRQQICSAATRSTGPGEEGLGEELVERGGYGSSCWGGWIHYFMESCRTSDQYTRGLEDMTNASLQRVRQN
jgi:hypothetical protein